jgi:hypothetical protein
MSIITNSKCGRPATGQNVSSMPARNDHANGSGRTWLNVLQATCELANPLACASGVWGSVYEGSCRGGGRSYVFNSIGAPSGWRCQKILASLLDHGVDACRKWRYRVGTVRRSRSTRNHPSNPHKLKVGPPEIVRSRTNKAQLMSPAVYDTTPSVRRARESIVMPRRGYRRSSTHFTLRPS